MIDSALNFLKSELEVHLKSRFRDAKTLTALGSMEETASAGKDTKDRLVLSLLNIEREGVAGNTSNVYTQTETGARRSPQALNINLVFLVAANFPDNYQLSLSVLSEAIGFFQANPVFVRGRDSTLPKNLDRLRVQWQDLDLQSNHNIWTALGGNYMPSVVYKAGMLIVDDPLAGFDVGIITGTDVES